LPFCYANLTSLTLSSECDEYEGEPPEDVVDDLLTRVGIAAFYCMYAQAPAIQHVAIGKKDNEPYGWCFVLNIKEKDRKMEIEFYSSFDWALDPVVVDVAVDCTQ
jgi:hypothetical protein